MMKRRKHLPALLLALLLMLALAPAAYADTDANTPKITQQPDVLILQLGTRWSGVEFELRTDAGIFPVPVVVDESGIQADNVSFSQNSLLTRDSMYNLIIYRYTDGCRISIVMKEIRGASETSDHFFTQMIDFPG